jgi:hypothetical protein
MSKPKNGDLRFWLSYSPSDSVDEIDARIHIDDIKETNGKLSAHSSCSQITPKTPKHHVSGKHK